MRRNVTVALSGDGGDEGFGGYNLFWQLERIAKWQQCRHSCCAWAHMPVHLWLGFGRFLRIFPSG
ncbi:MAG: hypothetical protein IPJ55_17330 [Chloracidobacterium sp.]|nr:hypothetical protein [Chloracidobacterium sp.]